MKLPLDNEEEKSLNKQPSQEEEKKSTGSQPLGTGRSSGTSSKKPPVYPNSLGFKPNQIAMAKKLV